MVIEQRVMTADPISNEPIETWVTWRQVFASAEVRRGREFFERNQTFAATIYRFQCRFNDVDGITAGNHRVIFEGRTFDISNVLPDFAKRFHTHIDAVETV